eukprot:CAMPEP_0118952652 /NCGR_PEP_ID=MMETSP1169-20130426/55236_1 /TAXON_ID=36882 /ORGANISM="Pyramimonas obovata, Strain CCMP722" /LENGTH=455 /DNA_ID=CAMNT_0006899955 /DNA_START=292 /DNA_END=1660 /DNA_ORIENTATION=+
MASSEAAGDEVADALLARPGSRAQTPDSRILDSLDRRTYCGFQVDSNRLELYNKAAKARPFVVYDEKSVGRRTGPQSLLKAHVENQKRRVQGFSAVPLAPKNTKTLAGIETYLPYTRVGEPPVSEGWMRGCVQSTGTFPSTIQAPHKPRAVQTYVDRETYIHVPRPTRAILSRFQIAFESKRIEEGDGGAIAHKYRGAGKALGFWKNRAMGQAFRNWLEYHKMAQAKKAIIRNALNFFLNAETRAKAVFFEGWKEFHAGVQRLKHIAVRMMQSKMAAAFDQWVAVWQDGCNVDDHNKAMRLFFRRVAGSAFTGWKSVYLGSKAFRLEMERREELHAEQMAHDAARQALYDRIVLEKREEAEDYAAVHVGYLVSGPKTCTECGLPIHVDGLIMVQNYGRDQCHSQCVQHTEKCAVIHLGRIEVGHMPLIKDIFNIKRFVSQANRCDAEHMTDASLE